MTIKTGSAWAGTFVTLDATGALATPSSGPAGVLYVDGTANAATVTITGSNPYKWAVTLPTLTAGQRVDMYITATIATIGTAGIVASEQADTALVSDVKAETALILADTGTDGVVIGATQGAITWGQQKIVANVAGEGALDIVNTGGSGSVGIHTEGVFAGQYNEGTGSSSNGTFNIGNAHGLLNQGDIGQYNTGAVSGIYNTGNYGVINGGDTQDVLGYDPALALEETLTAIKGDGWTDETLKVIKDAVTNVDGDLADVFDDVGDVKAVVDTILADTNEVQAELADGGRTDLLIDGIKAKSDLIPASPAESGEYTVAIAALQTDLDNPDQYKADVSTLATTAHVQEVEDKVDIVDGIADAILDDTGTTGVLLSTSALGSIFDDEVIVGTYTARDLLKIMASALAGKLSGGGTTTLTFKSVDGASDVIEAIVDANGNRTSVTLTV